MSDVLAWVLARLRERSDVLGVLLFGSYSLGTNTEGSDVDLLGIVAGDTTPEREVWTQGGLDVELNFMTAARWL